MASKLKRNTLASVGNALIAMSGAISVYAAVGLSTGGLAGLTVQMTGWAEHAQLSFALGFCLPFAPVLLYFASVSAVRRKIRALREAYRAGEISLETLQELEAVLWQWYLERWCGKT